MDKFWETIVTVASGIIGVAVLSVIVSRRSQTPQVIQAGGSAFANSLGVAMSPVTDRPYSINTSYPAAGFNSFSPLTMGSFGS